MKVAGGQFSGYFGPTLPYAIRPVPTASLARPHSLDVPVARRREATVLASCVSSRAGLALFAHEHGLIAETAVA